MRKSTATAKATPKASREDAKNAKAREDAKEKHCKGKTSKGLGGKDVQSHAPWSRTKSVRSASVVLAPGETGLTISQNFLYDRQPFKNLIYSHRLLPEKKEDDDVDCNG